MPRQQAAAATADRSLEPTRNGPIRCALPCIGYPASPSRQDVALKQLTCGSSNGILKVAEDQDALQKATRIRTLCCFPKPSHLR